MSRPPTDQAYTNLRVNNLLSANNITSNVVKAIQINANDLNVTNINAEEVNATSVNAVNAAIQNLVNDQLSDATLNDGIQFQNIQEQVKLDNHRNFMLSNTIAQLTAALPLPTFPAGRTVTFNNMTSSTTLDIYVTEGYPNAVAATIIPGGSAVAPGAPGVVWPIPTTAGWSGNFAAYPTGAKALAGSTLAEFGFNQLWSGSVPPNRDTWDVSNVPPGIGTKCNDGPHSLCSAISLQSGFSSQQSKGYNVGIRVIPPAGSLPSATVTVTEPDGNSSDSIGYPNDTAFPKQQTIELTGSYVVDFLDPVVSLV